MAEEQKPVAVPETTPAVVEPVVEPVDETKLAEAAPVAVAPAETAAEETPAAPVEEAKEEAKPIEAGTLEHKGAPANFPKYVDIEIAGKTMTNWLTESPQELAIYQDTLLVWNRCSRKGEACDLSEEREGQRCCPPCCLLGRGDWKGPFLLQQGI